MIYKSDISSLKKDMEEKIGQKIIVKESPGKRSKPLEKEAVIEQAYPNYFRVKFDENDRRGSYNYTDLKNQIILELHPFISELTGRHPIVLPVIMEVRESGN